MARATTPGNDMGAIPSPAAPVSAPAEKLMDGSSRGTACEATASGTALGTGHIGGGYRPQMSGVRGVDTVGVFKGKVPSQSLDVKLRKLLEREKSSKTDKVVAATSATDLVPGPASAAAPVSMANSTGNTAIHSWPPMPAAVHGAESPRREAAGSVYVLDDSMDRIKMNRDSASIDRLNGNLLALEEASQRLSMGIRTHGIKPVDRTHYDRADTNIIVTAAGTEQLVAQETNPKLSTGIDDDATGKAISAPSAVAQPSAAVTPPADAVAPAKITRASTSPVRAVSMSNWVDLQGPRSQTMHQMHQLSDQDLSEGGSQLGSQLAGGQPRKESEEGSMRDSRKVKKSRLVWTPELHRRFVNAVNHLGIENSVPKIIVQLMNVEGLSRQNVASHLQKYRMYLKKNGSAMPEDMPLDGSASFQKVIPVCLTDQQIGPPPSIDSKDSFAPLFHAPPAPTQSFVQAPAHNTASQTYASPHQSDASPMAGMMTTTTTAAAAAAATAAAHPSMYPPHHEYRPIVGQGGSSRVPTHPHHPSMIMHQYAGGVPGVQHPQYHTAAAMPGYHPHHMSYVSQAQTAFAAAPSVHHHQYHHPYQAEYAAAPGHVNTHAAAAAGNPAAAAAAMGWMWPPTSHATTFPQAAAAAHTLVPMTVRPGQLQQHPHHHHQQQSSQQQQSPQQQQQQGGSATYTRHAAHLSSSASAQQQQQQQQVMQTTTHKDATPVAAAAAGGGGGSGAMQMSAAAGARAQLGPLGVIQSMKYPGGPSGM